MSIILILFKSILIISGGIYILTLIYLYLYQDSLLYFPSRNDEILAQIEKNKQINEFKIITDEGETMGRLTGSGDCMIFYIGGNAENTDYQFVQERKWGGNCIFATMNYRGYGASTGRPNEQHIHEDSVRLFEKIHTYHKPKHVYIVGRSLGTNPAIYLTVAKKSLVNKLILITPYDSMSHVAASHYPLFPVRWLIKDGYNSLPLVENLDIKTLIFQASDDIVIPAIHTETLIQGFQKIHPTAAILPNTNHSNIMESAEFLSLFAEFIKEE